MREWPYFKNPNSKNEMERYKRSVATLCEYITTDLNGEVLFISTCQGIKEYKFDDSKVANEIYQLLSAEAKQKSVVDNKFHTPEQLRKIIEKLDVVISTRLHFAIQSLCVGVPVLPIAYEFKTKELFSKLIDNDCILDIDTITESTALNAFKNLLAALPAIRSDLFSKIENERLSALDAIEYLKQSNIIPLQ